MVREMGLGTLCIGWNLTSLAGREPKLVQEVVLHQLNKAELTSIHSASSGVHPWLKGARRVWEIQYHKLMAERRHVGVLLKERECHLFVIP